MQHMVFIMHLRWLAASKIRVDSDRASSYIYSKIPPHDEQLIYSKNIQDDYWNKFKREKCIFLVLITQRSNKLSPDRSLRSSIMWSTLRGNMLPPSSEARRVSSSWKGRHRYGKFRKATDWHCKWNKADVKECFKQRGVCLCVYIYRRCGLLSYTSWKVQCRKRVKIQFLKRGGEKNSTRLRWYAFPPWWRRFLRNVDTDPPNQTVSYIRRQYKLVSISTFARICNLIFTKQWNIALEGNQVT